AVRKRTTEANPDRKSTGSPRDSPVAVPASHASLVPMPATGVLAGMAPQAGRASIDSTVSNVWGCSPGPGMLWTRRPRGTVTAAGTTWGNDPGWAAVPGGWGGGVGAGSVAKASSVSAATP